jgi:predicted RNA-binding Zn-ribbon protein involved in translation (DUF1610 family)
LATDTKIKTKVTPDNAEDSFKCSNCGAVYSREGAKMRKCPVCNYICTLDTCRNLGASNEDY